MLLVRGFLRSLEVMTKYGGIGTLNLLHQVFEIEYKGEYFDAIYTYIVSFGNELFPSCTE